MVYNGPRRKSKFTSVRLTGMFKTQKRGLCVGTINNESIDQMIGKIKEAKKVGKELTLFLWVNDKKDEENQPYFTISMDIARPKPERGKAIEADPFDDTQARSGAHVSPEDDPFA